MAGLNKVQLIGYLGSDPELRYTKTGTPVANFSMATSEAWNDRDGQRQEKTEWHKIIAFGKTGELVSQYLNKGRQVYVEGRIQTRQWEDRDGNKRYTTEIVAKNIVFLGGGNAQSDNGGQKQQRPQPEPRNYGGQKYEQTELPPMPDYGIPPDDDYPF